MSYNQLSLDQAMALGYLQHGQSDLYQNQLNQLLALRQTQSLQFPVHQSQPHLSTHQSQVNCIYYVINLFILFSPSNNSQNLPCGLLMPSQCPCVIIVSNVGQFFHKLTLKLCRPYVFFYFLRCQSCLNFSFKLVNLVSQGTPFQFFYLLFIVSFHRFRNNIMNISNRKIYLASLILQHLQLHKLKFMAMDINIISNILINFITITNINII